MAKTWYTRTDRTPVDWVSVIGGGRALTDIVKIVDRTLDGDPTVSEYVWRSAGTTIAAADLATAKAEAATGAPTAQIVDWTPPGSRFVTPYDLSYAINNLAVGDGSSSFYSRNQVDQLIAAMQAKIDQLTYQVTDSSGRLDSMNVDLSTARIEADNAVRSVAAGSATWNQIADEVARARGSYTSLPLRLYALEQGEDTSPNPGADPVITDPTTQDSYVVDLYSRTTY